MVKTKALSQPTTWYMNSEPALVMTVVYQMVQAHGLSAPLTAVHDVLDWWVAEVCLSEVIDDLHCWSSDHDSCLLERPKL